MTESFANGNGVTRETKIWKARSLKISVAVGILAIVASTIALGDRFLFTQSEGKDLMVRFEHHEDWGKEKYQEVISRLGKIEEKQDLILDQQRQIMVELGIHVREAGARR